MNFKSLLKFFPVFILLSSVIYVSGEILCEELPVIKNGQLLLNDRNATFSVNETISYTCDEDFRTDERDPKVACILKENVAIWTEGECKQIVISCHHPGYIENAELIGNIFTFPHNITYRCNEGYRMNGLSTKYCSKSGQWQPQSFPDCEAVICPALNHPQNGKVLHSNRRPTSVAVYKCDRYYKLVGDLERECQADGTWSGSNPTCEKITCKAPIFPNGRIIGAYGSVYNASDIVIFQCNDADGIHVTSKCLENGEWSLRPPTCSGTVTEPSVIPTTVSSKGNNSDEIKGTTVIVPSVISTTVSSKDNESDEIKGTTAIEPSVIPITISTKDSESDEIKVDSCEDPGKIKYGDRSFTTLHINSTVTYTCDEGYQLKGKSTLLCMENGKWDLDKLPICVKPLTVQTIIGIVFGVVILICVVLGGYFYYRYRLKSIRGYGEKSKALTADATDIEEITGLEREKKHIPVTVL